MRFRQVHLDFHTSEAIPGIGKEFSKDQFQDMLKLGHVDSITVFSKCHHGWSYHPTETNEMHPGLDFDLMGAMIEAAHEIGVKTPVYLSAGLDEKLTRRRPDWLIRNKDESLRWAPDFLTPGYHLLCMNTPYLDMLASQVEEAASRYDADGIFLDIVGVQECYCQSCVAEIRRRGSDPRDPAAMKQLWEETYVRYAKRMNEAVHGVKPGLPVFHNGGHIRRGRRDLARLNTHLELESLPTGGWGYDHFPLSARYSQPLGMPFLGMTGKFHTTWGEFGGYKHPNALRYETALSLANGARCSIGDQLHPEGRMDPATYRLIGAAYREVEAKEEWCLGARNVADVALLSVEAAGVVSAGQDQSAFTGDSDAGAVRMLLEGKLLFDIVDLESDWPAYKLLILPDVITVTESLKAKLQDYLDRGGKVLATGRSGLASDGSGFAIDLGVRRLGKNPYSPAYFRPSFDTASLGQASFVLYSEGQEVELADGGTVLGQRENPYFNRDVFTFCSHQHTPSTNRSAGPGMVESSNGIYLAWDVFAEYAEKGSLALKEIVLHAIDRLIPRRTLRTNLPAQGVVTVQAQDGLNRWVNHLLYAAPVKRGKNVEVVEDLLPLRGTSVEVEVPAAVKEAYLAPQGTPIPFTQEGDVVSYTVPEWECHQMVVLQF